jgi:hypothetical protein
MAARAEPERAVGLGTVTRGWLPTRKWWGALVSGLFTVAAHAFGSSGWDNTEWAELMTLGASLAVAYFVPNKLTPGGAPDATPELAKP